MGYIDLHVHTTASDGTFTPTEVVNYAVRKGLKAIAITDHDTIDGVDEAKAVAISLPIEVVSGTELSCGYLDKDIHILGYFVPTANEELQNDLKHFQDIRDNRNIEIISRFNDAGIPMTIEDLYYGHPEAVITRANFARFLIEKGYCRDKDQAFKKYLAYGGQFVPYKTIGIDQIMEFMRKYNLFSSLAHPFQYRFSNAELETLIQKLKDRGLNGLEVWHSSHHKGNRQRLKALCEKYELLPTGGTDFHGSNKSGLDLGTGYGGMYIHESILHKISGKI